MSTKLDTVIRNRLAARKGDWLEIAKRAGVSHSWMSKFMNGHIPNPGIRTLEKLNAALKARKGDPRHEPTTASEVDHD